jgi:hypothetical protein
VGGGGLGGTGACPGSGGAATAGGGGLGGSGGGATDGVFRTSAAPLPSSPGG